MGIYDGSLGRGGGGPKDRGGRCNVNATSAVCGDPRGYGIKQATFPRSEEKTSWGGITVGAGAVLLVLMLCSK